MTLFPPKRDEANDNYNMTVKEYIGLGIILLLFVSFFGFLFYFC